LTSPILGERVVAETENQNELSVLFEPEYLSLREFKIVVLPTEVGPETTVIFLYEKRS
jgi:hypothetical protein